MYPAFEKASCSPQYTTQKPSEFFITLADDLSVPEFVALTNSVIDYLVTIPEITQFASNHPGQEAFLAIRSDKSGSNAGDAVRDYRATFMMGIENDARGDRAYFWVTADAEMRHPRQEGQVDQVGQEDAEAGRIETASFVTRRELGRHKPERFSSGTARAEEI